MPAGPRGARSNTGSIYGVSALRAARTSDVRLARLLRPVLHAGNGVDHAEAHQGGCHYEIGTEIQSATKSGWIPDSHRHAPMRHQRMQGRKVVAPCGA